MWQGKEAGGWVLVGGFYFSEYIFPCQVPVAASPVASTHVLVVSRARRGDCVPGGASPFAFAGRGLVLWPNPWEGVSYSVTLPVPPQFQQWTGSMTTLAPCLSSMVRFLSWGSRPDG